MLTLRIDLEIDATLVDTAARQVPFAIATALNRTVNDAQSTLRGDLRRDFTIAADRETFMDRLIKIGPEDRANRNHLVAAIGIQDPGGKSGKGRSEILTRHVFGGSHRALDPEEPFFIPSHFLRPTDRTRVPQRFYPSNLRLADRRGIGGATSAVLLGNRRLTKTGGVVRQGKRKTWVVPFGNTRGLTPGIYQRTGPDREDIQLLWLFKKRVNLGRPRLDFVGRVRQAVRDRFQPNFDVAFARALDTAHR
jgi:hypothetical protein